MSSSNSRPASVAGYYADGSQQHRSPSVGPQHQRHDFVRPKSSASSHRPSSRATNRPPSSASAAGRPVSRTGNTPTYKPFHRLPQRQISRLMSTSHSLVSQVTGLNPDDDENVFRATVDMVTRSLDYNVKAAPSSSMSDIAKLVNGRTERARINSQDSWADALQLSFTRLKSQIEKIRDIDSEITPARLPDHLSFLMHLSVPPTQLTVEHAENYVVNGSTPRIESETFSWKNILDEEPFEGQHWEGVYGLPPGSTVEGWETRSLDSTPPFSPLLLDDFGIVSPLSSTDSLPGSEAEPSIDINADSVHISGSSTFGHRQLIEDLQRRQYWRAEWQTDASLTRTFTVKDASSLGPSADRILGDHRPLGPDGPDIIKYIHEHDAVREMLMAFQGYKNSFLRWSRSDDGNFSFEPTLDAPRIIHLTWTAQLSIVQTFSQTASTIEHLRRFVTCVSGGTAQLVSRATCQFRRMTRTMEAFSEAVETQLHKFNSWCAARERDIILSLAGSMPPLYVSLLNLERTIRDSFSYTFDALLEVLRKVMGRATRSQDKNLEVWMLLDLPMRFSPFTISTFLLDTLLTAADGSSSNGETETSKALMQVFAASSEPMWSMVGLWLKHGMPTRDPASKPGADNLTAMDDELFIQATGLPIFDPEFWTEGFAIRDVDTEAFSSESIPLHLSLVGNHILRAGKAVGLLRILDLPLSDDAEAKPTWMIDWPTFTALLQEHNTGALVKTSKEHLSRHVHDSILPYCQTPQKRLAQMIATECDLWLHLTAIEELYFMWRGDPMAHFSEIIFAKMDSMQAWSDFHFLNNTFRDIVQKYPTNRMEPTLIRFSYSGSRDQALRRTVEALDGLLVEYAAPFPLTYLFGLHSSSVYRSVFVFLLQMRRAKGVLESAHTWDTTARRKSLGSNDKLAIAMRSKLLWFINTLLGFIMTHVLHRQLSRFHASLKLAGSLDETISLHESHLGALESECLLHGDMDTLRQAILDILDIALRFYDALSTHVGQDEQASPRMGPKLHRSRHAQQERSAAIRFATSLRETVIQSSDSESDPEEEDDGLRHGPESYRTMPSASRDDQRLAGEVTEMQDELDELVRFVRTEVEGLAGGTSVAASTFSILAFALEDWDR
ncbi:Spc98 family-domain-containing protein [Lactarius quietus]|nr:Spc98 family-domain-containing protein [Lactarius quietus]